MDAPVPLELELALLQNDKRQRGRSIFADFRGSRDFVLPPRIIIEHEQLGAGALFLVPISANARRGGIRSCV
jgi:hypothetical protein